MIVSPSRWTLDPTVPEVDDDAAPITGTLAAEVDATISNHS
jgi:hypothetical protein